MAHRLAERLGKADVNQMLREMTAVQWLRWKVFMAMEPSIRDMLPLLFARVRQDLWNVQLAKTKSHKRLEVWDFLDQYGDQDTSKPASRQRPARTREEGQRRFEKVAEYFGAMGMKPVDRSKKKR